MSKHGPKFPKPFSPSKSGPGAHSVRPRLHTPSHLRIGSKSAFPAAPAALGPPAGGGGPAFDPGMGGGGGGPAGAVAPSPPMAAPPAPGDMGG